MSGQWSGGVANRTWQRPGRRVTNMPGDRERSARLFEQLKDTRFWCDVCGSLHPLKEHSACRIKHPFQTAFRGST